MSDSPRNPLIARLLIGTLLVLGFVGAWILFIRESEPPSGDPSGKTREVRPDAAPPDPRLVFDTPFRNVKPEIKYTGDASCAGCHPNHDASYHKHPMGRSADRVGRPGAPEDYSANNPFQAQSYTLRSEKTTSGDRHIVSHPDGAGRNLPDHVMLATIALGSGTRGRSYLAVEEGAVFQTPVSWFGQANQKWDLSPSYDLGTGGRRTITKECLYCHVDSVQPLAGSLNRIAAPFPEQLNVGCERCHGPGELHVRERTDGANPTGIDTSIVNPKHLAPELRSSICQQCHLQGEERITRRGRDIFEYRPGLPWEQFVAVFVRHPNITDFHKSVGQFDQMHVSKCFTGSNGKLDCTSCHDAHSRPEPAQATAFYRTRCLTCHESKGCSAPQAERTAKADSCIACHMPKADSTSIVHTAVTDHRVLRRAADAVVAKKQLPDDADPIIPFAPTRFAPPIEERERDLAIAFTQTIGKMLRATRAGQSAYSAQAETRLNRTLDRWPGDALAWDTLGKLLGHAGSPDLFLDAARKAAQLEPDSDLRRTTLAEALIDARKPAEALKIIEELEKRNPRLAEHRILRATVLMNLGEWSQAEAACRDALAIHPQLPVAYLYLAQCRYRQGDLPGADAAADTAVSLAVKPDQKTEFRQWYEKRKQ